MPVGTKSGKPDRSSVARQSCNLASGPLAGILNVMQVVLPDPLESSLSPEEVRINLALGLYISGRLGFGRAAEVAGIPRPAFQRMFASQRLPMDYTLQDLADDAAAIVNR